MIAIGTIFVAPAWAATQTVSIGPSQNMFIPSRVAVKPGESVTWTNPGSEEPHNVRFEGSGEVPLLAPDTIFSPAPTRSFPAEGAYRYYCEVHGGPGGAGMSGVVYVNATGELPPLAQFSVAPNPAVSGNVVTFDASASTVATGRAIAKYEWDLNGNGTFGDPEDRTGTTPTTSQTYLVAQDLNVQLRVTDSQGATDVVTRAVRIGAAPANPPAQPLPDPPPVVAAAPQPAAEPGTTPAGAAPAPGAFSFRNGATASRARGVLLKVTCAGRCSVTATLAITATVARKARLGRTAMTIGTARATLAAAGTKSVTIRLTRKARLRMARLGSVSATLRLAVVGASGSTVRRQRAVTLRR